jgi:hypothetical protein
MITPTRIVLDPGRISDASSEQDSTQQGTLIPFTIPDTPLKITCKGFLQMCNQRHLSLTDLPSLGLSLGNTLKFSPLPDARKWKDIQPYKLPEVVRHSGPQELRPFDLSDGVHQILPKLVQLTEEIKRLRTDVHSQARFSMEARMCFEKIYGGTGSFVLSASQELYQHSEFISQIQKVLTHLVQTTFPSTEQQFARFAHQVYADLRFLQQNIQQIYQALSDFDQSIFQISLKIIQESLKPVFTRLAYMEQDVLKIHTSLFKTDDPSSSTTQFLPETISDIAQIPVFSQRLTALEVVLQQFINTSTQEILSLEPQTLLSNNKLTPLNKRILLSRRCSQRWSTDFRL